MLVLVLQHITQLCVYIRTHTHTHLFFFREKNIDIVKHLNHWFSNFREPSDSIGLRQANNLHF